MLVVPYRNATSAKENPPSPRTCVNISRITTKSKKLATRLDSSATANEKRYVIVERIHMAAIRR